MKGRLKAKLAILALWMLPAAPAQAHVRLVPQLGTGYLNSVVVSPDGRFVLTGGDGVRLWDAATARQLQTFPEAAASVAFSPDSRLILTGGGDVPDMSENSVRIWDLASGKLIRSFSGLTSEVTTVAFSSDARSVFAGSRDGTASIWDVATGSKTGALDETSKNHGLGFGQENSPAQYQIPIENTHAAFSPDGRWVLNLANKPKFYAILIGTAKYGDHKLDLVYPAHDAESIATGLEIGAGKPFGAENIHLHLLSTDAEDLASLPTKQNIIAAFEDVKKNAKSSDLLLVYLSGHGVNLRSEKDSYYYLTTDARSIELENNPALRQLSTVSGAELRNWLGAQGMPLKEVLIIDTCAAGAANEELIKLVEKRDVPPDQRRAIEFLKDSTGTIILMGSADDKSSYEATKYGQGLLTYALLQGMKGRSIEDGSRLNVSRWFQNASEDVPQLAQSIGGIQKPVIAMPSGAGFPVALLIPADQAKIPLAAIKAKSR